MTLRENTRVIRAGSVYIGGGSPVTVQSMTNTKTGDVTETVRQILALEDAGCDIIRAAVPDAESAEAIRKIKKEIHIPLVADVHFDYRLALSAIKNGADKVRINPGNIGSPEKVKKVADAAAERGVPIRIGVNGGSLEKAIKAKYGRPCAEAIVESAMGHIAILEALDFGDICVSLKSSDAAETVKAYKLIAEKTDYPLHVGLTEAGTLFGATVKSSAAIGSVLLSGIGDTIRVSVTGDPLEEVRIGRELLRALRLGDKGLVEFVSCPTCGRTSVDLIGLAEKIEAMLRDAERRGLIGNKIKVAVMGCAVNGPGEASDADIGLAGGKNEVLLFEKGVPGEKLTGSSGEIADEFVKRVIGLAGKH